MPALSIAPTTSSVLRESVAPLVPVVGLMDLERCKHRVSPQPPHSKSIDPAPMPLTVLPTCFRPCPFRSHPGHLPLVHSATCSASSPSSTMPSAQVSGFRGLSNCRCGFG